jgi:DNA repair protein SbcC/Rad50
MIPVKLWLRNFLSYGENTPTLDFRGFKMACLSGRNGHGKSALLDAMTWAVWGEARKPGHSRTPDADLVRLSTSNMAVEFTFWLNGQTYQVYREYQKSKRGNAKLEFRVKSPGEDQFSILTGNSKKETQQRIIDTLGLDYRTFVNSSFLRQGKADEFTKQSPADRKVILGNILALDLYDKLLDETKTRLQEIRTQRTHLETTNQHIAQDLETEEATRQQHTHILNAIKEKDQNLDKSIAIRDLLQDKINAFKAAESRMADWKREQNELHTRLQDNHTRFEKAKTLHNQYTNILAEQDTIREQHEQFERIRDDLNRLLDVEEQFNQLDAQRSHWQKTIDEHHAALREEIASHRSKEKQIAKNIHNCETYLEQKEDIQSKYARFRQVQDEFSLLESLKIRYDDILHSQQQAEKEIQIQHNRIERDLAQAKGGLQRLEPLQSEIQAIHKESQTLAEWREQYTQLEKERDTIIENGQETRNNRDQASSEIERLQTLLQHTEEKIALLEKGETQACPLCHSQLGQEGHQHLHQSLQQEMAAHQQSLLDWRQKQAKYEERRNQLVDRLKKMDAKLKIQQENIQTITNKIQSLTKFEAERDALLNIQKTAALLQEKLNHHQFAEQEHRVVAQCQEALASMPYTPKRHLETQKKLHDLHIHLSRWERLQEEEKRHTALLAELQENEAQIQRLTETMNQGHFALEEKALLDAVLAQCKPLQEQLAKRKSLHEKQNALRNAVSRFNTLQQAKQELPDLEKEMTGLSSQVNEITNRIQTIETEYQNTLPFLNQQEEILRQQQHQDEEIRTLREERNALQLEQGRIQGEWERLQKQKMELQVNKKRWTELTRDEHLHDHLRQAFSRDGIPAMIIDHALPELENDTNRLLHRLTHGNCSIKFESQREKKSGGISETLDIKISDELGTRDYEMYSGGEAFRADLALRIALSQLLCRRAGSKLQTLIIDEGFGTQDSEGLANIVEAINEIQDEFDKIIVVTHLEEVKEKFLARIEVQKEPGIGSTFNVFFAG